MELSLVAFERYFGASTDWHRCLVGKPLFCFFADVRLEVKLVALQLCCDPTIACGWRSDT
jgi:hypothetical protein